MPADVALIAGLAGEALNVGTNIFSAYQQNKIAKQNFELQKETAEKNLQLQMDSLNYSKELQKQLFEREDNAMQRQVKDNLNAGLSPIASLAGANAGATVGAITPQQDSPVLDASGIGSSMSNLGNSFGSFASNQIARDSNELNKLNIESQIRQREFDIEEAKTYGREKAQSEIDLLKAQKNKIDYDEALSEWSKDFEEKKWLADEKHRVIADNRQAAQDVLDSAIKIAQANNLEADLTTKELAQEYQKIKNEVAKLDAKDAISMDAVISAGVVDFLKLATKGKYKPTETSIDFYTMVIKKLLSAGVDMKKIGLF